jgi:hypothetical protein
MYPTPAYKLSADQRRAELVTLLTTAVRKLAKTSASSPESREICRQRTDFPLTSLDVSEEKRLHVFNDNHLDSEEL